MATDEIKQLTLSLSGATACGIATVREVAAESQLHYSGWTRDGKHGSMSYMTKYDDVRNNPALLLEGAKSMIVCAFPYYNPPSEYDRHWLKIAKYARGADYHHVVKERLLRVTTRLEQKYGAKTRICVDTAPLRERYWAQQAGLGFVGRNNTLIVPGKGSYFFLGTILTDLELEADKPCELTCGDCNRCVSACPSNALDHPGALDARKCFSCLTIEHRGDFDTAIKLRGRIAGCDTCQDVCPHNANPAVTNIEEFKPMNPIMVLSDEQLIKADEALLRPILRKSALSRIKVVDMLRNIRHAK